VRRWRELGEAPVAVAEAIPEIAAALAAAPAAAPADQPVPFPAATIEKCTGRELNPYAFRRRNLNPNEINMLDAIRLNLASP